MDTLSTATPPTRPQGSGLWKWLLRALGLEAWFQQTSVTTQAGQEERVFLRLTILPVADATKLGTPPLLEALNECLNAVQAGGGEVVSHEGNTLLLSWPAEQGGQQAVPVYFQLREQVRRRSRHQELFGAASLGWVTPRPNKARPRYQGEVLNHLTGMLRESQQGHGLLVASALHHRLDQTLPFRYELHVGFNLPGHRYPATLFRVTAELPSEPDQQHFIELATGKVSALSVG